ncbi:MAG: AsmA family protein [Acetobacteraceae bacterium]|jgi:uncharacterized protein involved in outer membrane biogenesis
MRWRRIRRIVLGLVVGPPIVAISILIVTFNANSWKPRIQAAVMRATGREVSLNGPISLKWSPVPTIEAPDVALANIDGGATANADRASIGVALSLLANRIEIPRLVVIKPDVLIETAQHGRGNWVFAKLAAPNATPTQPGRRGSRWTSKSIRSRSRMAW